MPKAPESQLSQICSTKMRHPRMQKTIRTFFDTEPRHHQQVTRASSNLFLALDLAGQKPRTSSGSRCDFFRPVLLRTGSAYFPLGKGLIALLTGAVRRSGRRSLNDRCAVSGPVPCSGARGAGTRYWTQSAPRFTAAEPP